MADNKASTWKICVSVGGGEVEQAVAAAREAAGRADVVEIRLDLLTAPRITPFLDELTTPLLFTNRPEREGGRWTGDEDERLALLRAALDHGAAYVDIELKTDDAPRTELIKAAKKSRTTRTIVSWHHFTGTPSDQALLSILQEQYRSGADIGKIVTLAESPLDVLRVLNLQKTAREIEFPLIAFCMGRAGAISRVATVELGGFMTYTAADNQAATAPGQLPLASLAAIRETFLHAV